MKTAEEIVLEWRNRGTPIDERLARLIAAELGKAYAEIERLKVLTFCYHAEENVKLQAEIARLRDMNQKLWEALTPEKRHDLNLAELAKETMKTAEEILKDYGADPDGIDAVRAYGAQVREEAAKIVENIACPAIAYGCHEISAAAIRKMELP